MPMTEEEHLELMHQTGITAISVASIIEGELTQPRELGIRKIVFGAASLSKPVFAYLVLTLIEANKANKGELKLGKFIHLPPHLSEFNLNTPLSRILAPEARYCNDKKTKAYAKKLTAKLILSHQTGLPINPKDKEPFSFTFKSGEEFGYSGVPFLYLQQTIEKLTGSTLEALAQEFVFKPLHMRGTFCPPNGDHPIHSANSLYTTASDYLRFITSWMNDEKLKYAFDSQVSMTKDAWAVREGVPEKTLKKISWGLGWGLQKAEDGTTIAFHAGDMNCWRTFVAFNIEKKTGIVYFANSPNGFILLDEIISSTVDLKAGLDYFFGKFPFARKLKELPSDWRENPCWGMKPQPTIPKHSINPNTFFGKNYISDEEMARNAFGQGLNTSKKLSQ